MCRIPEISGSWRHVPALTKAHRAQIIRSTAGILL
jgi:hypothetical protein